MLRLFLLLGCEEMEHVTVGTNIGQLQMDCVRNVSVYSPTGDESLVYTVYWWNPEGERPLMFSYSHNPDETNWKIRHRFAGEQLPVVSSGEVSAVIRECAQRFEHRDNPYL